jgi:hypothetical protein
MQFIYRGEFSKGLDTQTSMGVIFRGREPSEVTDVCAISWLKGHPEYEQVEEPAVEEEPKKKAPVKKPKAKAKK